jgi:hypothetical protein
MLISCWGFSETHSAGTFVPSEEKHRTPPDGRQKAGEKPAAENHCKHRRFKILSFFVAARRNRK